MSAGRMTERLTIQTPVETTDTIGGVSVSYVDGDSVWAEPRPIRGDERLQAQALGHQTDYRFRVRARSDLTPKSRMSWTQRWPDGMAATTLEVRSVMQDTDRAYMLIDCAVYQP